MNKKDSPRQFYDRLKVFINAALTAAKEDLTGENADLDNEPHLELIAFKTFVKGLPDTLKPAIASSKPKTLIEALQSVEQLEKFPLETNSEAELYFTRPHEMSGPNPQPRNIRPNSPARPVHEKQGQHVKIIDNNDPNLYDRNSMPYHLNRDDMQLPPPLSINSQGGINAHPILRYGNNPSQPPSILKRTESRAPSPYQRPNSPASRPVSPGRNYNQNQYNRNQYPYNMQYPYPFPPTYPPLFYYPNPWMFPQFTNHYPGQNPSQAPNIGPNITMPNWYPYNLQQGSDLSEGGDSDDEIMKNFFYPKVYRVVPEEVSISDHPLSHIFNGNDSETLEEKFSMTKKQSLIPEPPKCEMNSFDSSLLNMEDLPYSEEEIISTKFLPQEGKENSFNIPADSHKIIAIHTSHPNGDAYLPRIDIRPGVFIGDAAVKVTDGVCYTMATNKTGCEVKINLEKPELQDFDLENSEEFFETEPENEENRGPVKKLTGKGSQSSDETSSEIASTDAGSQNESEAVPAAVKDRSLFPDLISQRASAPAAVGEISLEGEFFDNEHGLDTSLPTNLGEDPVPNEEGEDWWARSFLPPAVTPTPLPIRMKHSPSRESFQKSTPLPLEERRRIPSFWKNLSTIPQENSEELDSEDKNQEKASTARNGTAQGNNHQNQAGDLPTASSPQQHNLNDDIQPDLDYVQPPTMIKTSTRECLTLAKNRIVHFIPANLDLSTPNNGLLLDLWAINIEQFRKQNLTVDVKINATGILEIDGRCVAHTENLTLYGIHSTKLLQTYSYEPDLEVDMNNIFLSHIQNEFSEEDYNSMLSDNWLDSGNAISLQDIENQFRSISREKRINGTMFNYSTVSSFSTFSLIIVLYITLRIIQAMKNKRSNINSKVTIEIPDPDKAQSESYSGRYQRRSTLNISENDPQPPVPLNANLIRRLESPDRTPREREVLQLRDIARLPSNEPTDIRLPIQNVYIA
ncbi:hypothetical protein QAD02_008372 [Eretmocerus hayati]|uniref:Uncharacterized protein n=1 Tax=Eretmocerus hayati TaxID=131215 RepID=A0ACC2N6A0_9HYME|nr:hypothetical protein QAD02_008372 [Eretmocerus hayati]